MQISKFTSVNPAMGETRTYEHFSKWLGSRPARLGVVARLYENLTASYLTESLKNIFYRDRKSSDKFKSLDSMYFEWEVNSFDLRKLFELLKTPICITLGQSAAKLNFIKILKVQRLSKR